MKIAAFGIVFALFISFSSLLPASGAEPASKAGASTECGGKTRTPVDSVGYALSAAQVEAVIALADSMAAEKEAAGSVMPCGRMIGGICPHDDYIYAGPAYVGLLRRAEAPLVVLVGVSHGARRAGIKGKLVFDGFSCWSAPYGRVKVSGLRESLIAALPDELVLVSDTLHAREHSLEGLVPFLQYPGFGAGRSLEILPVLVTYLPAESMDRAAGAFASALHSLTSAAGMRLGRDYTVIISSDCVHYGDEAWGGRNYAPFGADSAGYERAVARDKAIAEETLTGMMSGKNAERFREMVDSGEFEQPYKVSWCGVYSIPFGVILLSRLCELEGREPPVGVLLEYGTSLDPGRFPLERAGLGATNIATIRHWVGYASIGYW